MKIAHIGQDFKSYYEGSVLLSRYGLTKESSLSKVCKIKDVTGSVSNIPADSMDFSVLASLYSRDTGREDVVLDAKDLLPTLIYKVPKPKYINLSGAGKEYAIYLSRTGMRQWKKGLNSSSYTCVPEMGFHLSEITEVINDLKKESIKTFSLEEGLKQIELKKSAVQVDNFSMESLFELYNPIYTSLEKSFEYVAQGEAISDAFCRDMALTSYYDDGLYLIYRGITIGILYKKPNHYEIRMIDTSFNQEVSDYFVRNDKVIRIIS